MKLGSPSEYNTITAKQTLDILCTQRIKCRENVKITPENVSQFVIENVNNRNRLVVSLIYLEMLSYLNDFSVLKIRRVNCGHRTLCRKIRRKRRQKSLHFTYTIVEL